MSLFSGRSAAGRGAALAAAASLILGAVPAEGWAGGETVAAPVEGIPSPPAALPFGAIESRPAAAESVPPAPLGALETLSSLERLPSSSIANAARGLSVELGAKARRSASTERLSDSLRTFYERARPLRSAPEPVTADAGGSPLAGGPAPASRQAAKASWRAAGDWLRLDLGLEPPALDDWRHETGHVLLETNEPSVERAMAVAASRLRLLKPEQSEAIEASLSGKMSAFDTGEVRSFAEHGGRVYVGAWDGLYELHGTSIRRIDEVGTNVFHVAADWTRVFASGRSGMYILEKGAWRKQELPFVAAIELVDGRAVVLAGNQSYAGRILAYENGGWKDLERPPEARPDGLRVVGGSLHVVGPGGLWRHDGGRWLLRLDGVGEVHEAVEFGGETFVASDAGIHVERGGAWAKDDLPPHPKHKPGGERLKCVFLRVTGGRLYAARWYDGALFVREKGRWKPLPVRSINDVTEIDGKLWVPHGSGIVVRERGRWRRPALPMAPDIFHNLVEKIRGRVLVGARDGVVWWTVPELPKTWKSDVLADVSALVDSGALAPPKRDALLSSDGGRILGRGGRTLFGGLRSLLGRLRLDFPQASAPGEAWPALARWLARSLGLKAPDAEAWRLETARLVADDREPSVEAAVARAASRLLGLSPERAEQIATVLDGRKSHVRATDIRTIEEHDGKTFFGGHSGLHALEGEDLFLIRDDVGFVHRLLSFDGTLYMSASKGFFALRDKVWRRQKLPFVGDMVVHDGRLVVHAGDKVWEGDAYELRDGAWVPLGVPSEAGIDDLAVLGGRLHVLGHHGLWRLEPEGWKPLLTGAGEVYRAAEFGGETWLATESGLRAGRDGAWRSDDLPRHRWFNKEPPRAHFVGVAGGELWAVRSSDGRLFRRRAGRWRPQPVAGARRVVELDGRLYAPTDSGHGGLFVLERGRWRRVRVPMSPDIFYSVVAKARGRVLVGARDGLAWWSEPELPAAWKQEVLEDVSALVGSGAVAPPKPGSGLKSEGRRVVGRTGRTLFDALGRLLSRLGAGFAEDAGPPASQKAAVGASAWGRLTAYLAAHGADAVEPAVWRSATLEELRSEPDIELGEAAFRALRRLRPEAAGEKLRGLLSIGSLPDLRFLGAPAVVDGRLLAGTGDGLFLQDGGGWRRVGPEGSWRVLGQVDGVTYLGGPSGLHVWDGGSPRLVIRHHREIEAVGKALGRLHVAVAHRARVMKRWRTRHKVLALEDDGFREVERTIAPVRWLGELDGKLEASEAFFDVLEWGGRTFGAAQGGVYSKSGDDWIKELDAPASQLTALDGRLHAATQKGVFRLEEAGWRPVLPAEWPVELILDLGGAAYLVLPEGVKPDAAAPSLVATPNPRLWAWDRKGAFPFGWRERALAELSVETPADRPSTAGRIEPGESGELTKDGRSIFSGLGRRRE